jgi:hypothetical protein
MQEPRAQRTLVKSPPELWAEVSDIDALARHLGEFGEIRITRLDPETTVAWEGDRACGTVALEPSGWGTKVTLTAKLAEEVAAEPVTAEPEPDVPALLAAEHEAAAPEPLAAEPEPVSPEPEAIGAEPLAAEPEPVSPEPEAVEPEPLAAEPAPLAAEPAPLAPEPESDAVAPEHEVPPAEAPKVGFFARLFGRGRKVAPVVEDEPEGEPQAEAEPVAVEPESLAVEPEPVAVEPEPAAGPVAVEPEPAAEPVAVEPEPVAVEPEPVPAEPPAPLDAERAEAILTGVLDDLGSAHHRPFSRT